MIFYVYFDPGVISEAEKKGIYARQSLIPILPGFLQNCLIIEFEDYRNQSEIKSQVNQLENTDDRLRIKNLLAALKKRNRFIFCLKPDYNNVKTDIECVFEQAIEKELDYILLVEGNMKNKINGIEISTLETYQNSQFELKRSKIASDGMTLSDAELDEYDFLDQTFKNAFRYANKIEICDKIFGREFKSNFEYTCKIMFNWLENVLTEPEKCHFVFHCGKPEGKGAQHIKTQLGSFKGKKLSSMAIQIQFYDDNLPHDRFILTDQFAFEIGRGMDFLDKQTRKNRNTTIGYKDIKKVNVLLNGYKNDRLNCEIV